MAKKKEERLNSLANEVVVGSGAFIKRSGQVDGDVLLGDKYTNVSSSLGMPGFKPPTELEALHRSYLAHLQRTYRALDFKGIPQFETLSRELLLEEVYVPLLARPDLPTGDAWKHRLAGRAAPGETLPEDVRVAGDQTSAIPERIEEALAKEKRVVVLGDPGSGKSTLLKHLALRLAAESNASNVPLPILVPLGAYAEALADSPAGLSLGRFLPEYFARLSQPVPGLAPLFESAIALGRAVILLDGLDEVQRDRHRLTERVEAFAAEAAERGNRLVVTSRIVGYREAPLPPRRWALYTLLDFERSAIEQFASQWCLAFEKSTLGDTPEARASAESERRSLLEALEANPGVTGLASNPLLLTILALIKRHGVTLPNRRVELYELYLRTLITAWSKASRLDKKQARPSLDYLETVSILGPLALWLRETNPTAGLIPEERLIEWLTQHFKGEEWGLPPAEAKDQAREFLDSVRSYSSLLLERGQGRFGFIHLTFEEALAARGLVQLGQLKLENSLAVVRRHLTDPAWRETVLLAVGVWGLVREQPLVAGEVVRAILHMESPGEAAGKNILLAGACLEDVGDPGLGRAATKDVTEALWAASQDRSLPPTMQRDAGFILGRTRWVLPDLEAFVSISSGPFEYGDDKRRVVIKQPFEIAKYPVTNSQYERFIKAGGYDRQEFWSAEGWAWRTGTYDSRAPDYLKSWLAGRPPDQRNAPFFWRDPKWNNPLAPVVGVSWFEAEAYCHWLAQKLGRPIRLPTEEEWERAARHMDGREYPWGNEFDHNRLNCAEFWAGKDDIDWNKWFVEKGREVASTTIVGQFPEGNAECGAADMSGNVWEWTNSWFDDEKVQRAVRGGSWDYFRRYARCAYRYRGVPDYFADALGFRVVSPGS